MLTKLIKYDIGSNGKPQFFMVMSMICLAVVALLLGMLNNNILDTALFFLGFFASLGVLIGYIFFHVAGFYNSMAGRESYFTHTIPVSMNKIVFSKFISAIFWAVISISAVCAFWFIIERNNPVSGIEPLILLLRPLIIMLAGQLICMMTLVALSTGISVHPKFGHFQSKILTGIVAFIVLYYVCAIVQLAVMAAALLIKGDLFMLLSNDMNDSKAIDIIKFISIYVSGVYAVLSVLFYSISVRIFDKSKSL